MKSKRGVKGFFGLESNASKQAVSKNACIKVHLLPWPTAAIHTNRQ
jgi:hypothetical protein